MFLDALRMSHTIEFKARLDCTPPTAQTADLLLAKLQIHEITEKDVKDMARCSPRIRSATARTARSSPTTSSA